METAIEGDIAGVVINKRREKKRRVQINADQSRVGQRTAAEWPPKRRHHQGQLYKNAREMLHVRQQELLRCKYIKTLDRQELSRFAGEFIVKSKAEQLEILATLDRGFVARS